MNKKTIFCGALLISILSACSKGDAPISGKSTTTDSSSVPGQAVAASAPTHAAAIDRGQYRTALVDSKATPFTESDWKKFREITVSAIRNSSATTVDTAAALKFPEYTKISSPFEKDDFKKKHLSDLTNSNSAPQKLRIIAHGNANALLERGDPLNGIYKGTLTMGNSSNLGNNGLLMGYMFGNDSISYTLKFKQNATLNFQQTVPVEQAKYIESKIKRDDDGDARFAPIIIYATVTDSNVTYGANGGQSIELILKPEAVDLADSAGKDAKPILQLNGLEF